MRTIVLIGIAALALGGCGRNAPAPQASANATAEPKTAAQYEAEAAKDEAEATRLLGHAGAQPPAAPAPAPGGGQAAGSQTLGAGDEQLNTGQYYKAVSFTGQVGKTYRVDYDTQGYRPVLIVLDPDKKVFSQTVAAPKPGAMYHLDDEIKPDRDGQWHVLLTTVDVGAKGAFTVDMQTVTERPLS